MAMKEKRVNVKISDPYVLDLIADGGVQATLAPLMSAGGLLHKAGVMDQLLFIQQQGLADDVGSLEALRLAIDFAEKIQHVKTKKGAHGPSPDPEKTPATAVASEKPVVATAERKAAF